MPALPAIFMFERRVDEHLKLVLPLARDAEELTAIVRANLAHLQKWMPWATDDYSIESARDYIKRNLHDLADGKALNASVVSGEKIVGQIGFHNMDAENASAQMGYWLAADAQGKGIMSRSCRFLADYGFNKLDLNRIQINCNVENAKSRAIPERLGFQLEGVQRQAEKLNDRFGDWAIYAMLKQDWRTFNI